MGARHLDETLTLEEHSFMVYLQNIFLDESSIDELPGNVTIRGFLQMHPYIPPHIMQSTISTLFWHEYIQCRQEETSDNDQPRVYLSLSEKGKAYDPIQRRYCCGEVILIS